MLKPIVRSVVRPVVSGTVNPDNVYVGTIIWGGISYEVFTDPATGLRMRIGIRDGYQMTDEELLVGGFDGVEGVGWWNVEAIELFYPKNVVLTAITGGTRISWDNLTGNNGYEIWVSISSGTYFRVGITLVDDVSYDDTAYYGGYPVQYKVMAYTGVASSVYAENCSEAIVNKLYLTCPAGNEYGYVADNGLLDFGKVAQSWALCGWLKGEGAGGIFQYIVGKGVYGSLNGRYTIYCDTDNFYRLGMQGSAGFVSTVSTVLCTDGKWHFHCITYNSSNNVEYLIDNVVVGSAINPGTGGTMANQFEFYLGADNDNDGSDPSSIAKHSFKEICVYPTNMSAAERGLQMRGTIKSGYLARYKGEAYPLVDETGNFNLTGVNLDASNIVTSPDRVVGGLKSGFSVPVEVDDLEFVLTSFGDGSGVGEMNLVVSESVYMSIDGVGKFYTDAAGTTGESTSKLIETGALRKTYIRVTSGTATVRIKNVVTSFGALVGGSYATGRGWETANNINYPCLSTDCSKLTHVTAITIFGHNTTYGDISAFTGITVLEIACASSIHTLATYGSTVTCNLDAFNSLTTLDVWDKTVFTGSLSGKVNLQVIWVGGLSSFTCDLSTCPALTTCITYATNTFVPTGSIAGNTTIVALQCIGLNTLSGSIAGCTNLALLSIYGLTSITVPNVTLLTKMSLLYIPTIALTSANTNQILADFVTNKDEVKTYLARSITLNGTPTGQGITDKAALQAYRTPNNDGAYSLWTIGTN
jgi:hypothetical protein